MPSPFYRRSPGFSPRALLPVAACAALSLGLPQAVLATDITIIVNTLAPIYGNSNDGGLTYNYIFNSNTLTIRNGASVAAAVYGGYSESSDDVMNNRVTVSSGSSVAAAIGGSSGGGSAKYNHVTLDGATTAGSVTGGLADTMGDATGNNVVISGSQVGVWVRGGMGYSGTVADNSVIINDSNITGDIDGGYSAFALATNNTVTISGSSTISGNVHGGRSGAWNATGNTVILLGGLVQGSVYGGGSVSESSTGNTVIFSGGQVAGSVYGGAGGDFTGNTLNVTASGLTAGGLGNFQYLNFYLPSALAADGTMLTVTGTADLTNRAGTSSTVNVGIAGSSSHLVVGDKVTLIKAGTLTTAPGLNSTANGAGMQGVTLAYTFDLEATGTTLTATVTSGGARDESKALSEGVLASAELVNRGGDMIAGEAMTQAVSGADGCGNDRYGAGPCVGAFGVMLGGKARYNSGSHTDISSVSLATGFAKGFELDQGSAVLGAFLEYGNGSYDAYNSFATDRLHGSGDLDYVGVGMLGRMDFVQAGPGHAYTEASLRLGRTHNKYDNADMGGGIGAHYKTSPAYYGGHVGAGYVWDVAPKTTLDLSAKYLVTHQNASRVTLGSGDDIRFDAVTSKRTRLGGRVFYAATDRISPYAGAAWDYEFDAKADATTSGIAIDAPSLKGGTGIGELGVAIRPSAEMPLSLDFGLQGYAGKREGVTGSLKAVFRF